MDGVLEAEAGFSEERCRNVRSLAQVDGDEIAVEGREAHGHVQVSYDHHRDRQRGELEVGLRGWFDAHDGVHKSHGRKVVDESLHAEVSVCS